MDRPLNPLATLTLAATATSANGAISPVAQTLEIQNAGGSTAFVRWGIGTQTAVTTDYPVLSGQSKVITCGTGNTNFAAICAAGESTTLYITSAQGF